MKFQNQRKLFSELRKRDTYTHFENSKIEETYFLNRSVYISKIENKKDQNLPAFPLKGNVTHTHTLKSETKGNFSETKGNGDTHTHLKIVQNRRKKETKFSDSPLRIWDFNSEIKLKEKNHVNEKSTCQKIVEFNLRL